MRKQCWSPAQPNGLLWVTNTHIVHVCPYRLGHGATDIDSRQLSFFCCCDLETFQSYEINKWATISGKNWTNHSFFKSKDLTLGEELNTEGGGWMTLGWKVESMVGSIVFRLWCMQWWREFTGRSNLLRQHWPRQFMAVGNVSFG